MSKPIAWSHSALKDFEGCARRYHATKILKLYPYEETSATRYGNQLHKAAEDYIKDKTPFPTEFSFMKELVDALAAKAGPTGKVYAEQKMALSVDLEKRSWFDKDVWVRGVADMLILDKPQAKAWVIDWKTGNDKYPDTDQLLLMALMVMSLHPEIEKVHSALFFVAKGSRVLHKTMEAEYDRKWLVFRERVARIEAAKAAGTWNPSPSPLCGWCPHKPCEHNPKNTG
jgi:RecB family exonuclease